jgi:ankyrin repeat protein
VRLLLGLEEVNLKNNGDVSRQPLLVAAVESNNTEIVRLLLRRAAVDQNQPDVLGQTPLICAAKNGNEASVRLLLG